MARYRYYLKKLSLKTRKKIIILIICTGIISLIYWLSLLSGIRYSSKIQELLNGIGVLVTSTCLYSIGILRKDWAYRYEEDRAKYGYNGHFPDIITPPNGIMQGWILFFDIIPGLGILIGIIIVLNEIF